MLKHEHGGSGSGTKVRDPSGGQTARRPLLPPLGLCSAQLEESNERASEEHVMVAHALKLKECDPLGTPGPSANGMPALPVLAWLFTEGVGAGGENRSHCLGLIRTSRALCPSCACMRAGRARKHTSPLLAAYIFAEFCSLAVAFDVDELQRQQ